MMVEDTGINEEQRTLKRLGLQCRALLVFVLSIIMMVLFLFCYFDPSVLIETWASTVEFLSASSELLSGSSSDQSWKHPEKFYVAYPHDYQFVMNEPEKCGREKPFAVLMIPVASSNRAARDAIRNTWGTEKLVENKSVSLFFFLGLSGPKEDTKLLEESEMHHDLLQADFLDSYHNLTIKTMMILEWLSRFCRNASYAMKVDSDIFLNVNNLVKMLSSAPPQNYMTGLVTRGGMVRRNHRSKWYLPKSVFPLAIYPPYTLGLGYVFSLDLPEKLVEAARHVKAVYIEDVYLGMCMKHLGIPLTGPPTGGLFNINPVKYNRCRYSKLIATTTQSLRDQVEFWRDLQKPDPPC